MAAIASLTQRMIAVWAVGDAESIAGPFVEDGTLILADTYCDGRAAIQAYFAEAFRGEYRGTQVTGKPLAGRFFGPDAGVLLTLGGVLEPGETEVSSKQAIRASWTVVRRDGSPSKSPRPCRRTRAFPNAPATCANISLKASDHAACPSRASSRASSTTDSRHYPWPRAGLRSLSHAGKNHSSLL